MIKIFKDIILKWFIYYILSGKFFLIKFVDFCIVNQTFLRLSIFIFLKNNIKLTLKNIYII